MQRVAWTEVYRLVESLCRVWLCVLKGLGSKE